MEAATWAAWGPTFVSVLTAFFLAGGLYNKVKDHSKQLDEHDKKIESVLVRLNEGEVELAKLQSWRDGYNAASARSNMEVIRGGG